MVLAIVAIRFAGTAEKDSHDNFERTQKMMAEHYDKTKDVLAEIDKRATVTEKTVTDSQEKLLGTVTSIINETVIPKKQDIGRAVCHDVYANVDAGSVGCKQYYRNNTAIN